jgi:hypothetical protein
MENLKIYRDLFVVAFFWNMIAAVAALVQPDQNFKLMYDVAVDESNHLLYFGWELFWINVALFGVGYLIVAFNPRKNHGIIALAIVGKSYIGMRWIYLYFSDQAEIFALVGGIGDIVFALIFIYVLPKLHKMTN